MGAEVAGKDDYMEEERFFLLGVLWDGFQRGLFGPCSRLSQGPSADNKAWSPCVLQTI